MTGVDTDLATLRDWIGDPEDYSDEDRGAAERACDACDGVEAELSRLREQRDALDRERDAGWRTMVEQRERAEAAEARCARLQQALTEIAGGRYGTVTGLCGIARRALAGPDTPADSQEDKT